MNAHNDQSTVMPEPWTIRYTMNAIWCLDDVEEANGGHPVPAREPSVHLLRRRP